MTMYRIQKDEKRLQPFRSNKFGTRYFEKDLEDWFESNPIVLTDGEPAVKLGLLGEPTKTSQSKNY